MALTLIESAKIALGTDETRLQGTIMELYATSSDLLMFMPFMNISGRSAIFDREQSLPSAGFRALNEAYSEGQGTVDRVQEALAIAGGDADVDAMLIKTQGSELRGPTVAMKVKALGAAITKTFIKGDVESTPKEFDGLQVRCGTGDQRIAAGSTGAGDVLSLTKLDELIDTVDDPTHLLMNKTMKRRMAAAARLTTVGGYITYELDSFGRRVHFYSGLPILVADKDNEYDDIMPFTEATTTGAASGTSIYCLSFAENGVMGIQNGNMDVRDMGELDTKPVFRTRIEWYVSMAILRARAAARLYAIADGVVAA